MRSIWNFLAALCCATVLLSGCTQPKLQRGADLWGGRMALTVEGDAQKSFSSTFLLEGSKERGTLRLSTALGTVLAELAWTPEGAVLTSSQGVRNAPSLDALLTEALGSPVPVEALFAWLQGNAVQTAGWQANLEQLPEGRLTAVRNVPAPRSTLRLVLDR